MKWFKYILMGMIVSFYYFPFTFTFLPGINTKNAVAALGIVFVLFFLVKKREFIIPKELFILLLLSGFVSIIALFSITYNQTPDETYVTYIRSSAIWLSGAFTVCVLIWLLHGRITFQLITNYLAGVCVFQCAAAMAIHFIPAVKSVVDATVSQGQGMLDYMERLYGIGCSLDVGGSRFSAVLIAIAFSIELDKERRVGTSRILLVLSFTIITIIGNMIARTTMVGVALGLLYIAGSELWRLFVSPAISATPKNKKSSIPTWVTVLIITIPIATFLYRSSEMFYELMRFGFEGFFSLFEKGTWDVASNETLKSMIVWPEELRTWIIGDGYFDNQSNDINYIGDATRNGFYMGTDIGYLRFIFYFGVIGLIAISAVMVYACLTAIKYFPEYKLMILLALLAGFIIWLKVSTDLFPFYALMAGAAFLQQEIDYLNLQGKEILVEPSPSD